MAPGAPITRDDGGDFHPANSTVEGVTKPVDDQMTALSSARHDADVGKQIAKLRNKGLKHRTRASGYLVKAKKFEERAASLMQKANRIKQESSAIIEKAKTKASAASEYQKRAESPIPGTPTSDIDLQVSRLQHEEARLTRQANQLQLRASGMTERASKMKKRSLDFMQKHRTHEMHSEEFMKKADELDRRKGQG